jgi:hypothetical protein
MDLQSTALTTELLEVLNLFRTGVNDVIKFTNTNSAGTRTGTVPPGSYTISTLATALGTAMTTGDGVDTFTVTSSTTTNKVSITTVAGTGTLVILFTASTINQTIGFSTTANSSAATTVTGVNIFNLNLPYNLLVNIPEFGYFAIQTSFSNDHTTFLIPVIEPEGSVIWYTTATQIKQEIKFPNVRNFPSLNVRLSFANGEQANLNGAEWVMYFRIHYGK